MIGPNPVLERFSPPTRGLRLETVRNLRFQCSAISGWKSTAQERCDSSAILRQAVNTKAKYLLAAARAQPMSNFRQLAPGGYPWVGQASASTATAAIR